MVAIACMSTGRRGRRLQAVMLVLLLLAPGAYKHDLDVDQGNKRIVRWSP